MCASRQQEDSSKCSARDDVGRGAVPEGVRLVGGASVQVDSACQGSPGNNKYLRTFGVGGSILIIV